MSSSNLDFYSLLNSITTNQTFEMPSCHVKLDGSLENIVCKRITTSQLKRLVETIIDNPITQFEFNTASTKIFLECACSTDIQFNVIDRLLFLLQTRIDVLSQKVEIFNDENGKTYIADLLEIKNNLLEDIKNNPHAFTNKTFSEDKLSIDVGIPLLSVEQQLNEEIYSKLNLLLNDAEDLKKSLSTTFINEIAKCVISITIDGNKFDLSTMLFTERLKMIESLPASLIQKAIEYAEEYKEIVNACFAIETTRVQQLVMNGKLFSNH